MARTRRRDLDYAALREAAPGRASTLRVARIVRAFVHPLHVGDDREAEGRAAGHRRLRRRPRCIDARHLLRCAGRDDVHDQRHRLGRRPLVHHLRPADQRLDDDHVRGSADPARSGHLVEDRGRARRQDDVQLADGDPRAEEAGSGVHADARRFEPALPVPGRRAARRADGALGERRARRGDRRQLLADRERLADPVGADRHRGHAAQVRLALVPGVWLRRAPRQRDDRR